MAKTKSSKPSNNPQTNAKKTFSMGILTTVVVIAILAIGFSVLFLVQDTKFKEIRELSDLSDDVQNWYKRGKFYQVNGYKMFAIVEGQGPETLILIHGFPTSSFDFRRVLDQLTEHNFRVVVYDHLGFGFSDKPNETYVYSLVDQAEMSLKLWEVLGLESGHLVAHDMGDSVLTEILARRDRTVLPERFDNFFKTITFTNGGMVYEHINMRLSQALLVTPGISSIFTWIQSKLPKDMLGKFSRKQLESVWSPEYTDSAQRDEDIRDIQELLFYKGGDEIAPKTISYLKDRARLEPRWLDALSRLNIPCLLFWGDSDAVAPMKIPIHLAQHVLPEKVMTGKTLKNVGHFGMLEAPKAWAQTILQFVKENTKKLKK